MNCLIKDAGLAGSGQRKIDWAWRNMPVLRGIEQDFKENLPLKGLKVAVSVHVEAKTANLAKLLRAGGAEVALTGCNSLSTQDDVAAALVGMDISTFAVRGCNDDEYYKHLNMALDVSPDIIIDDGGDFVQLLHNERVDLSAKIIGGCEETTTGIHRLKILGENLRFPMIAVNDARSKHLFDNRYGTGQSTLTAILSSTNLILAGKTVVVAGYGMCGKGVAKRAFGMGAKVIVTEIDPVCALEAHMDGCRVMTMDQAAPLGDLFITVTGCIDVINKRHFVHMKDGAMLSNAGHFNVEINIPELEELARETYFARNNITAYVLKDGRTLNLLAEGKLVNLAAGDGHPAEIMDMSFALQARCVEYLARHGRTLKKQLINVPKEIDDEVAGSCMQANGLGLDALNDRQSRYLKGI